MTRFADQGSGLDWARRIVRRMECGDTVSLTAGAMAMRALRVELHQLHIPARPAARRDAAKRRQPHSVTHQGALPL